MPSFQTLSETYWPPGVTSKLGLAEVESGRVPVGGVATRSVPPTPVTFGSLAGVLAALMKAELSQFGWAAPASPDEARSVMPSRGISLHTQFCAPSTTGA